MTPWIHTQSYTISFYEKNKQTRFCLLLLYSLIWKSVFPLSQMFREGEGLPFSCYFPFIEEGGMGAQKESEFGTDQSALPLREFRKMQRLLEVLFFYCISFTKFKLRENTIHSWFVFVLDYQLFLHGSKFTLVVRD